MGQSQNSVTILLVDDNEVDVMGVQRAFKQSELKNDIVVAANGVEALTWLRDDPTNQKPYLVLLDLNMPRMNGLEFLKEVRNDKDLKKSVVFVLTTSSVPEDRNSAYDHNIAGYIVKGKTQGGFVDAVELLNKYTNLCELP